MNKNQRIIIFAIVGVMVFSVVGTGLLILADNNSSSSVSDDLDADLASQLEAINEQQAQQEAALACGPLPLNPEASPLPTPEVITREAVSELEIIDVQVGTGAEAQAGDCVTAHYHGTLAGDGTVFDSSYERGSPARFSLNGVILGWQEGVPGMKEGGIRQLVIPADKAYGETGSPPVIGPNADLVFTVELVKVGTE